MSIFATQNKHDDTMLDYSMNTALAYTTIKPLIWLKNHNYIRKYKYQRFFRYAFTVYENTNAFPLFRSVGIETINKCNNDCSFCPASRKVDTRPCVKMDMELFNSIIEQLANMQYSGQLVLSINNEPFLDTRIINLAKSARMALPNVYILLYTNGILLKTEMFSQIMTYLDFLIIDNYDDELTLLPSVSKIYDFCINNLSEYENKVRIYMRKKTQVLTSRAGQASNKKIAYPPVYSCMQPYEELSIRPDGKVSLCCSDVQGTTNMGDLTKESILNIWNNKNFIEVRKALLNKGRSSLPLCKNCDF